MIRTRPFAFFHLPQNLSFAARPGRRTSYTGGRIEQAFMDLILQPEIVHYCLDELFEFYYKNTTRIYEQILEAVLISYVSEDMGSWQILLSTPN